MQSLSELEDWYKTIDPWHYQTNPDDQERKRRILSAIPVGRYKKALDIGAGEGWITKELPAKEIHGIELSDEAASRFPGNVTRVTQPIGEYDLILATGVFYPHYNWRDLLELIKKHSTNVVLLSNIAEWEVPEVSELGEPAHMEEFKYREYTQRLRVYKCK